MSDPAGVPPTGEARPPGMDHDLYPYRPAPEAPRFVWPGGARIALTVTVLLEYREIDPPRGADRDPRILSPLGNYVPDWLTWSQHEYGNRVGIFRLLSVLDRFGVTPAVALGVEAAARCPELVEAFLQRGACFLAHGASATRRITARMEEDEERAHIAESRDAVARAVGRVPAGWLGQDYNESPRTPELLAEAGFAYTLDWSNDDRPYRLGAGGLLALPAGAEWDDLECMWLRRTRPQAWADGIAEAFATLHAEGGAAFNLMLHPWITGQPHRIRYLSDALSRVLGRGPIWLPTPDALAAEARRQL